MLSMTCPACGGRTEVIGGTSGRGFVGRRLACKRAGCAKHSGFFTAEREISPEQFRELKAEAMRDYRRQPKGIKRGE